MNSYFSARVRSNPDRCLHVFILLAGLILLFSPGSAAGQDKRITNETGMTFIRIQPGSFFMGSPKTEKYRDANEIRHKMVIQKPYYIQETEVTVAQWQAVMGKKWFMRKKGKPDMPVTRVSFYECEKFIKTLNEKSRYTYRLPTEAEWEYACRANTTTAYSWGENIDCSRAMYGNNVKKANECTIYYQTLQIPPDGPAPVKSFKPNPWGLYDMHGNVWEWCSDHYAEYMGPKHTGGMGHSMISSENRIRRGGSWYKYPQYLRSANRAYAHPGARFKTTGFRLVLEAQ